jgi:SAM-dependent methyltransferase
MPQPNEDIFTMEDVMLMLDSQLREAAPWWDQFYSEGDQRIPFFVNAPDENLVTYFEHNQLKPGKVLELGCGPGRNAIYLAQKGCQVDAIDLSQEAIAWAMERAADSGAAIQFSCVNLFDAAIESGSYDLIYDSGCFHHTAPHRRMDYLKLVRSALKPRGYFGLTCFDYGEQMCGEISDYDVYRLKSLKGGLAYTEKKLRTLFAEYKVVELRKMISHQQPSDVFGESFLWTGLFQKS